MKGFITLIVFTLLSFPPAFAGQEGQTNKIAIASRGKTMDALVSNRAGRCKCFLLFDKKGQLMEVLANPHRDTIFDAGQESVELLAGKGVTLVVAGQMGARMIEALQEKKIARLKFTGTVEDALERALEEKGTKLK
jgi:predicted Fe-Mo cluster-binding NifX family protein